MQGVHRVDEDCPGVDSLIEAHLAHLGDFVQPLSGAARPWLKLLGLMADTKGAFGSSHTARVANLCREIVSAMELEPVVQDTLELAAHLYGVGRLAVPSSILESATSLTHERRRQLKLAPRVTKTILAPLAALGPAIEAATTYAERNDGSGYPEGLEHRAIPVEARILAVADTYEALISDRPYRGAHTRSRALAIIQAQSGALFDGMVTDALENVVRG